MDSSKLNLNQVVQLLKLNNPFYIITDENYYIKLFSESANKIFEGQLKKSFSLKNYLKNFDINKFDKGNIVIFSSYDDFKKFKFSVLNIDSENTAFVFLPVINHLNPIKNYNITLSDFDSINYLSEYIFLAETTMGSLNDYDKIVSLLNKQNTSLREQNTLIESLSRFPQENPNPVLRIDENKKVIYQNHFPDIYKHLFEIDSKNYIKSASLINLLNECASAKKRSITRVVTEKNITYNITIRYDTKFKDFNLYITDITEHSNQIVKLKSFYEEILDQLPVDIAVFNKELKFTYINKKAVGNKELRHFLIGKTEFDYFKFRNKPLNKAKFRMEKIRNTFSEKKSPSWIDEYINDNNTTYILRTLNPIKSKDTESVKRVVGIGVDITQTLKYKQSLINNEKKWKTLVKLSSDLICVLNIDCKIIFISNSVKSILGYAAKELINKDVKKYIHAEDIFNPEDCGISSSDDKINYEIMRFKKKSGNFTTLRVAMRFDEEIYSHPCIILNAQDISELKKSEAYRFMIGIASEENERRRIARDLHDGVGQYLATTILYSSLLGKYVDKEMTNDGKQIYQNTVKMLKKVTEEVRFVSHNLMPSTIKDFGFINSVKQLIDDLKESNPLIEFTYEEKIMDKNIGISEQIGLNLFRSIQQIFNNSLKHGRPKKIKLSIYYKEGSLKISVSDDGLGFDTKKINYKKGIGIKSIYDRISNLGGEIIVTSIINEGTQVILKLENLN